MVHLQKPRFRSGVYRRGFFYQFGNFPATARSRRYHRVAKAYLAPALRYAHIKFIRFAEAGKEIVEVPAALC
jgi:hypothetical protein